VQQSRVILLSRGGRRAAGAVVRRFHPKSYTGRGSPRHCIFVAVAMDQGSMAA